MRFTPEFNQQQLDYLHNTEFLLAKRKISRQLDQLLASTEQELVQYVAKEQPTTIPKDCLTVAGKISRGENYRGLPYLVLDYPRLFKKEDIFTFRTMCWWGNFFSCTLHLQGKILDTYRHSIGQWLLNHRNEWRETYLCVYASPWEYHYGEDNYKLLHTLNDKDLESILDRNFIKISRKIGLNQYQEVPTFTLHTFQEFLSILDSR